MAGVFGVLGEGFLYVGAVGGADGSFGDGAQDDIAVCLAESGDTPVVGCWVYWLGRESV